MNRFLIFIFFVLLCFTESAGQTVPDTVINQDTAIIPVTDSVVSVDTSNQRITTTAPETDTVSKRPPIDRTWNWIPGTSDPWQQIAWEVMEHHPWMGFTTTAYTQYSTVRQFQGKEIFFYVIVFLLLLYALLRSAFPKYFNDLFRLFFRTTLKQRQIREQLMQTPLPSLLLNGFFILSAGLYLSFILRHYGIDPVGNFWLMSLYCSLGLSIAYFVKFLGLKISGWVFNMREAAASYIFIVFVVNKMIGILLLPFIILLAFTTGNLYTVGLYLSYCLIAVLLAYRFILSFAAVRNQVRVNPFHFFLYLIAFEIAPLLLVYKALLVYFRQTA